KRGAGEGGGARSTWPRHGTERPLDGPQKINARRPRKWPRQPHELGEGDGIDPPPRRPPQPRRQEAAVIQVKGDLPTLLWLRTTEQLQTLGHHQPRDDGPAEGGRNRRGGGVRLAGMAGGFLRGTVGIGLTPTAPQASGCLAR